MHRNPVRRGLVQAPELWRWSSFRAYAYQETGLITHPGLEKRETLGHPADHPGDPSRASVTGFTDNGAPIATLAARGLVSLPPADSGNGAAAGSIFEN